MGEYSDQCGSANWINKTGILKYAYQIKERDDVTFNTLYFHSAKLKCNVSFF